MKLPHAGDAVVSDAKILGYLLSEHHPMGRHKARFFLGLGFSQSDSGLLRRALRVHAGQNEISSTVATRWGTKYLVDGIIHGPGGKAARIRCVWFVELGKAVPTLVTAYPLGGLER